MSREVNEEIVRNFSDYLLFEKRVREKTRDVYAHESFLLLSFCDEKNYDVSKVSFSELVEYITLRKEEGELDERTIAKIHSALRSFFSFLVKERYRKDNPALLLTRPKSEHRIPKTLAEEDVEELLLSFRGEDGDLLLSRDYALFELIYSSGMRISEAISLDLGSYLQDKNQIRVVGKRNKERIVFIGKRASMALNYYINNTRCELAKRNSKKTDALFLGRTGKRLTRQAVHKRFHEHTLALGLDCTVHTLRHCFASHMLEHGADIMSIKEMLGHSSVSTTQIYTHLDTKKLLEQFDLFSPLSDGD